MNVQEEIATLNDLKYTVLINCFLCWKTYTKIHSKHQLFYVPNIRYFLFRTSVMFCSEHPSFYVPNILYIFFPNIWTVFIPNIRKNDFMFYILFRTPGRIVGCSEEQGRKRTNPNLCKSNKADIVRKKQ